MKTYEFIKELIKAKGKCEETMFYYECKDCPLYIPCGSYPETLAAAKKWLEANDVEDI